MNLFRIRTICVLGAAAATAFAGAGTWRAQAPYPTSATIYGAYMLPNSLETWAVTGFGSILHSADGGATWGYQTSPTPQQLEDVEFADSNHGIAVGNDKVYTNNGGQNWFLASGPPTGTLYDLSVVNASTAYACGGSGVVAKTSDGGQSWTKVSVPVTENLTGIDFTSTTRGWTVGASGVVYRTTDGGAHWTASQNPPVEYGRVSFVSDTEGWAGALNTLIHTTDGGVTWNQVPTTASAQIIDVFFRTPLQGWTSGFTNSVTATNNGGQNWNQQVGGDYFDHYYYPALQRVSFGDSLHGVTVGNNGILFSTSDGGATWINRQSGSQAIPNKITAINAQKAWAACDHGEIVYTTDGGKFWNRVATASTGSFTDIKMAPDGLRGFASSGTLWKTSDGGRTWANLNAPLDLSVFRFDTLDFQTVVAVGYNENGAAVSRSTDGGNTWTTRNTSQYGMPGTIARDVQMTSSTTAFLVVNAYIGKTTNGGVSWTKNFTDPSFFPMARLSFADGLNGWVGNVYGLWHTTNGGASWVQQTPPANGDQGPDAVFAPTAKIVYCADYEGALSRSTDGGQTWRRDSYPAGIAPLSLYFVNAETGWMSGQGVAAYNNAPVPNIVARTPAIPAMTSATVHQGVANPNP